ncbi:hypothetical protein MRX96_029636 [Rhipicephalus microplus]
MAYELHFHVIQVVLVWLPLVVHSERPVDTPAKKLQFPEDCGFSTDPSSCADTPELSRPFGTSSSSKTVFLSSNKSGNSERQWFSGRGGSTTVAMAYELRFHVIQVVLVWVPLVVHSGRPVDTPAKQLQFPEDCGFSTDPSSCADTPELSRPFGTSSSSETVFLSSNKSGNSELIANTPSSTTGETPAQIFLSWQPRTRLSLLHPEMKQRMRERGEQAKLLADQKRGPWRDFREGDQVSVKGLRPDDDKWLLGTIAQRCSAYTYIVRVGEDDRYVHADNR